MGVTQQILLIQAGGQSCALPIGHVIETMRPLEVKELAGSPAFVRGVSVIRGEPVPVVNLSLMLGSIEPGRVDRFALIRAGRRKVALAVESITGVVNVETSALQELPPLLRDLSAEALASVGVLDGELLMVLEAGRIVPEDMWAAIERESRS